MYSAMYLGRIVALADFPHTVRRLAVRFNKVRHPDDFILLVILDHIRLLDDRHEILGMTNLPLQAFPDLVSPVLSVCDLAQRNAMSRSPSPRTTISR
jgi:hypothetical protein